MSNTKQSIIFSFMLIALCAMLVALGYWFHYALELDIKKRNLAALDNQNRILKARKEKLALQITNPENGLAQQLKDATELANNAEASVYTDQMARKKLYEEIGPQVKDAWDKLPTEWKNLHTDWIERNKKIQASFDALEKLRSELSKTRDEADKNLKEELGKEDVAKKDTVQKRKAAEDEVNNIRYQAEELLDKINQVTRDIEKKSDTERDGEILFADPELKTATVDVGYVAGAKSGMKFSIYSKHHATPVKMGEILLTEVRASSSDGVLLPVKDPPLWDPSTGWEATEPNMRYSIFSDSEGEAPGARHLEKKKSKKEVVEELRRERIRQEQGLEASQEANKAPDAPSEPPVPVTLGFEPIMAGDWISNPDFVRIQPDREFHKQVTEELLSSQLRDTNLGSLTFYFADTLSPFRRGFLKRLCERNLCKVVNQMTPDVDFIVSTPAAVHIDEIEGMLPKADEKQQDRPNIAVLRRTRDALLEGKKYGSKSISDDELETFFLRRHRKSDLTQGKAVPTGKHTFFVVGETRLRSVRETELYIKELGGLIAPSLGAGVDYVVVGKGLTKARLNKDTGRIEYDKDEVPSADPQSFYNAVKTMGLKIIREEELAHFFGRE